MSEPEAVLSERLRAVDEALAKRGPSAQASERIRRELQQGAVERPYRSRLRWWPVLAFAAGAMVMGLVLLRGAATPGGEMPSQRGLVVAPVAPVPPVEQAEQLEPQPVPDERCSALEDGPRSVALGVCVQFEGVRVSALSDAELIREGDVVELQRGEVLFEVEPRPEHPLHVRAGAVDIEVVGTRFIVHQLGPTAWVSMLEGRVQVRESDRPSTMLGRGQRLEWAGPEPKPEPTSKTLPPKPSSKAEQEDAGLAALLETVATLRGRGEYQAAVEQLRKAEPRGWSQRSRELVSYEIGSLLERQLADVEAACAHWLGHRDRFAGGRHDKSVKRSLERLGCAAD